MPGRAAGAAGEPKRRGGCFGLYARDASGHAERSSGGQSCAPSFLSYSHRQHVHGPTDPAKTEAKSISWKNCSQVWVCLLYKDPRAGSLLPPGLPADPLAQPGLALQTLPAMLSDLDHYKPPSDK